VIGRLPRRWPIATMSVLAVTVVPTVLQFPVPAVRLALWRDRRRPRLAAASCSLMFIPAGEQLPSASP